MHLPLAKSLTSCFPTLSYCINRILAPTSGLGLICPAFINCRLMSPVPLEISGLDYLASLKIQKSC
jgi:hypothetical protein